MGRRIIALVKKDFRFNWKIILFGVAFPIIYYAITWAEYTFEHTVEEQENFLICFLIASLCMIPLTQSFNREQGPSTRRFLSALPVRTRELYIASMITTIIYMFSLAAMVLLGSWIFGMPCEEKFVFAAMPIGIFYSAVYILIYYMTSYNVAQIFILVSMMIAIIAVGGLDIDLNTLGFFSNPYIAIPVSIILVMSAICIIVFLCKKKRSIL